MGGKKIEQVKGDIEITGVDFAYPSRPNTNVMTDFSLDIKSGQQIALVGPSGSGKSTIVGLLEKFYTPNKGTIKIDGVDVAELDPMWLHRNCLGIVSQEPVLFAGTIKYNIAYALLGPNDSVESGKVVTMEQVENAAKRANAHSFIMDLPEKYDTILGEKGVSLSGGQKQRIAIARALLQDPKILLLDEATSALDTESERLVQAALDELMKGRTTICIAHRLTTVINSDVICVLVKGVMKEKGTHSELIKIPQGIYRNLAEKQMIFTEEKVEDVEDVMDVLVDDENIVEVENDEE
ncbi:abc transporter B family protein [Naegleria gruberi]|uniref:Abc transporter B family protein n=1 Tax=Naegleria gruberi TaxID=5762 RepID=D2VU82_NAEGR|nr:abc transporter B family protein [Naegleria gruberi]EFC39644.1 abc transporter B family protein [Naegleria gruberi]|eukprot:XP_002672388.1 abc transporter B family protein [Naegleria gruberi strain NEG-M]